MWYYDSGGFEKSLVRGRFSSSYDFIRTLKIYLKCNVDSRRSPVVSADGGNVTSTLAPIRCTWIISPLPSRPKSVNGVSVRVALCTLGNAAPLRSLTLRAAETRSTSGREVRNDNNPIKHAICNSSASSPLIPPAPRPFGRR